MMTNCRFWVAGDPKPQPRARATVRGRHARMYNPSTADEWKAAVKSMANYAGLGIEPIVGPISLELEFRFKRPVSHLTKKGELAAGAPRLHIKRPDADNLAKAVMDALTDIGVWRDDSQVMRLKVSKYWTWGGSGCDVHVLQIDE